MTPAPSHLLRQAALLAAAGEVAGRKRRHEEATRTASRPAEPHGTQEMRRT